MRTALDPAAKNGNPCGHLLACFLFCIHRQEFLKPSSLDSGLEMDSGGNAAPLGKAPTPPTLLLHMPHR